MYTSNIFIWILKYIKKVKRRVDEKLEISFFVNAVN